MDVVIAYLYGSLYSNIYMKVSDGIFAPHSYVKRSMYCVKLTKSMYGLKQSSRIWYNRLKELFLKEVFNIEYSYLSVIGALMYLTNNTRPEIVFPVNCVIRHSAPPTMHH
jgi:hypothetical protein